MGKVEHALSLAAKGFRVFPIAAGQKKPPLLTGWPKRATSAAEEVRQFWAAVPDANIGIHCEGYVVIDADVKNGGLDALEFLRMSADLPTTLTTLTPSGGQHLFYRLPSGHGGVPNSVGELGAGLDIRSAGGYVVAPGSQVAAGDYAFELESVAIAQAPEWLLDRLGQAPAPRTEPAAPVPDAPESAVDRATAWLSSQTPAIQGEGGDAHTFKIACGIRDQGVSSEQAYALLSVFWNPKCNPPWSPEELRAKIQNCYAYAQNEPGARAALPSDFPVISGQPSAGSPPVYSAPVPEGKYPRAKRLSEITIYAGNGNFVDGLCNVGELFQVIGAPGGRKSQIAGWLAFCVATKQRWLDRDTAHGAVLYIAAEREAEQAKRFTVWACAEDLDPDGLPLRLMGPGSTLEKLDFAAYIAEQAAALKAETGQECRLIVIDTTMASLPGADLNKTEIATRFAQNLKVIAAKVPSAAICAVHHTPKSGAETGMGSQGFDAAFEAALLIEANDAGGSVRQLKGNTTRDWIPPLGWTGEALQAERGGETFLAWRPVVSTRTFAAVKLKPSARRALDELCRLRPANDTISDGEWYEACLEWLGKRKSSWTDIRRDIEKARLIERVGESNARGADILWRRTLIGPTDAVLAPHEQVR